ncbi:MAG: hypothetical protein ABIG68_13165, partial [Acidobacteriota bacterium]
MRVLTDCPDQITGWFAGAAWQPAASLTLPDEERLLWEALGGGPGQWVADRAEGATDFFARSFIIAEAPGSQFDAVNKLLQAGCRLSGPLACLALRGRNFHGQRGRSWAAAPGNLHLVAAVRAGDLPVQHSVALTMLA